MTGVEAEVRPHPDGHDLGPGVGMLWIRSSSMMAGYLSPTGIDTNHLIDGWFKTGDLARIDASGSINLKGRDSEVINVSGMKVIPCDVEGVLATMSGVLEVKVYAGTRRSGEQFVKAALVLDDGVDVAAVRHHCEQHLVYYKRPQQFIPLAALPRTPAGKIIRQQLP